MLPLDVPVATLPPERNNCGLLSLHSFAHFHFPETSIRKRSTPPGRTAPGRTSPGGKPYEGGSALLSNLQRPVRKKWRIFTNQRALFFFILHGLFLLLKLEYTERARWEPGPVLKERKHDGFYEQLER